MSVFPRFLLPLLLSLLLLSVTTASGNPRDAEEKSLERRGFPDYRDLQDSQSSLNRVSRGFFMSDLYGAALMDASTPVKQGFTRTETRIMLMKHNRLRRSRLLRPQPDPSKMKRLRWNNELERMAQSYTDRCIWKHSDYRQRRTDTFPYVGENLAYSSYGYGLEMVQDWFNEYKNYDYRNNRCLRGMCGHYTQIVWAKTTDLGCGVKFCNHLWDDFNRRWIYNVYYVVCNYGPGGNIVGKKPYEPLRRRHFFNYYMYSFY